ncbi:MAG: GIY-YIG nuclease family protein [Clostridiales bacterium]|nr:GIY-YIG nuclease family protein [Clostridiales bacterium]
MDIKKELKQKYKELKTPMGVLMIKNTVTGKVFLDTSTDVQSTINKHKFQLKWGGHPVKSLQKEWKEYGEDAFEFDVLEYLEYAKDDENVNYKEELEVLKELWLDKDDFSKLIFYK